MLNISGTTNDQNEQQYCYWDLRGLLDLIIVAFNLTLFTAYMTRVYCKRARTHADSPKEIKNIDYFIMSWYVGTCGSIVAYVTQFVFSIVFFTNLNFNQNIEIYSSIYECLDFTSAFILMGCLYYVCFLLYPCIHHLDQIDSAYSIRHLTKFQQRYFKFLKLYIYARVLFAVPTLMVPIFVMFSEDKFNNILICSKIQVGLFIVDILICNISIFVTIQVLSYNLRQHPQNHQQMVKLRKQKFLLILAGACRLFMGVIFVFLQQIIFSCPQSSLARSLVYMLIGQYLLHLVPIYVILSIFNDDQQNPN